MRTQCTRWLKLKLAHELLGKQIPKEKIRVLMNFLRYYVHFENTEANVTLEKEFEKLTGRSNTMGIEELLPVQQALDGIRNSWQIGNSIQIHQKSPAHTRQQDFLFNGKKEN